MKSFTIKHKDSLGATIESCGYPKHEICGLLIPLICSMNHDLCEGDRDKYNEVIDVYIKSLKDFSLVYGYDEDSQVRESAEDDDVENDIDNFLKSMVDKHGIERIAKMMTSKALKK